MGHARTKVVRRASGDTLKYAHISLLVALLAQTVTLPAHAQATTSQSIQRLRAYRILRPDWALMQMPGRGAPRRGALLHGARVLPFAHLSAPGCKLPWWQVGPYAWMC